MKYFNTYKKIYLSQVALIAIILLIGWICWYLSDQPYWAFYFLGEYRYFFDDFWWELPLSFGYVLLYIALPLLFYIFTDILRFKKVRSFLQKLYNIFIYLCLVFNVFLIFFFWYEKYNVFEYFNNPWYEDVWRTIGLANSSPIIEKLYDLVGLSPYIIITVILFLILKLNIKAQKIDKTKCEKEDTKIKSEEELSLQKSIRALSAKQNITPEDKAMFEKLGQATVESLRKIK